MGSSSTPSPRRGGRGGARRRGLRLPARARDGDGPGAGLRVASSDQGYGDFDTSPTGTRRRILVEGTAIVWGRAVARRAPVARRPAPGAEGADRAGRGARVHPDGRLGARVYLLKETFEEAHAKGNGPDAIDPYVLDYGVLATTSTSCCKIRGRRNGMQARDRVRPRRAAWPVSRR